MEDELKATKHRDVWKKMISCGSRMVDWLFGRGTLQFTPTKSLTELSGIDFMRDICAGATCDAKET